MRSLDVICVWFVEFEQKPITSYHHRGHPAQSNISGCRHFLSFVSHTFSVVCRPRALETVPATVFSFRFMDASNWSKIERGGDFSAASSGVPRQDR